MRKLFLFFILSFLLLASYAQQAPQRIRFEHLSLADGLPENSVLSMLQDHLGFIWLGTQLGLARYDGNKIIPFPYSPGNPYGCSGKGIGALMEDQHGDVWIGAESLIRFERATQRFIEYPDRNSRELDFNIIRFIHQDKNGLIWTTRNNEGKIILSRFDPKTNVWVYFTNDPKNSHYLEGNGMYDLSQGFAEDKDGKIWVITQGKSGSTLQWLDRKSDKFIPYQHQIIPAMAEDFKKIWSISTDGQGTLYLATFMSGNGLFSLHTGTGDVKQFRHNDKDPGSLLSDTTLFIYTDKRGFLWITSPKGIDKYDPRTNIFTHYISKPGDLTTPGAGWAGSFYETEEGDIWFPTFNPTIAMNFYHRKTNSFTRYIPDNKKEDALWGFIQSTIIDRTGIVWIGSFGSGLNKESRTSQFPWIKNIPGNTNSLQDDDVSSIYEAPSEPGITWFGSDKGLDRYDKKTGRYTHYKHDIQKANSISKGRVVSITEDKKGRFWVGTSGGDLNLMERRNGSFMHFANDRSKYINTLKSASDGTLWIGGNEGLDHFDYDNNKFTHYQKADTSHAPELFELINRYSTADRKIVAIVHPTENVDLTTNFNLAGATDLLVNGMGEITRATISDHGWIEDASGKIIWDMNFANTVSDGNGRIRASVIHLKAGTYRLRYKSDDGYSYGHWNRAAPFHPELWGIKLSRINADEAVIFDKEAAKRNFNGLGDNYIHCITEDSKKNIWIGSNAGGIDKFDPTSGKFVSYISRSTGPKCVNSIIEDIKTGNFWVGDYVFGLLLMNPKGEMLKTYNASNGFPFIGGIGIQMDPDGILWIRTDNGLCRFDPSTEKFQLYNKRNGLPELKLNGGAALSQSADGEIYFGSIKGVNAFYPGQIKLDTIAPLVVLTGLDINGKPATIGKGGQMPVHISVAKDIELPYNGNELNVHFTSLLFNRGNESQFAYKLSPIDKDWVQAGTNRQARYSNLSPGKYTFTVKAANADGVWNEEGVSIAITILSPWWETWWFRLLSLIAIGMVIYAIIQDRSKKLKAETIRLEQKVTERTAQLQKSLEELKSTQSQLIQSEKMASLGELTAGIAHEIQNPLNFVNNFSEVNKELLAEMNEEIIKGNLEEVKIIANNITDNENKIIHHGKRADAIVKGMLQHSQSSSGIKEPTDINALADEYLRLAYHGLRAKDKTFNANMKTDFDETIGNINIIPQDIGRVLLNLYNNAFYAVNEKMKSAPNDYEPQVSVSTRLLPASENSLLSAGAALIHQSTNSLIISVQDNGNGISQKIMDKIFQPFFTTKPTGQGTGLGLSLSYDIVKAHGGELRVESKEGEGSEFVIQLPVG